MEFRTIIYIILLIIITFIFYQAEGKKIIGQRMTFEKKLFLYKQALLSQVLYCQ